MFWNWFKEICCEIGEFLNHSLALLVCSSVTLFPSFLLLNKPPKSSLSFSKFSSLFCFLSKPLNSSSIARDSSVISFSTTGFISATTVSGLGTSSLAFCISLAIELSILSNST